MRWFLLSLALMVGTAQSLGPQPKEGEQNTNQSKADAANNAVIVKAPSTQSDEEEAKKEPSEARIAVATENLVLVTFFLAVFTGLLFGATVLLARDAKRTGDRQAIGVQRSLELTQKSINLARKEFIASHRPRIIVRRFFHVFKDRAHAVEYIIANTGDTEATIVELSTLLWDERARGILSWQQYPSIPGI